MIKCRLKVLLAEHDITQTELSKQTGIRQAMLSDMCTGKAKHIPLSVLNKLCEYFDCQITDIFEYKKD